MRPLTLRLAGSGVLATCALLISREIGSDAAADGGLPNIRLRSEAGSLRSPATATPANARFVTGQPDGETSAGFERGAETDRRLPGGPLQTVTSKPLPAVRLSGSARLPAAILAQYDSGESGRQPTTPEAAVATDALVASFYLDLAERVAADGPDDIAVDKSGSPFPDDQATAVIEPGPVLDAAASAADEQFRALFGQNVYNRHSIESALEVLAPEQNGETSGP